MGMRAAGGDRHKDSGVGLDQVLKDLLPETVEGARVRSEGEFDRMAAPFERRIVIFGMGYLGDLALGGLRGAGIEPLAFCDNNTRLWGSQKDGIAAMSPAEAAARYKDSAAFVVAIYNSAAPRAQLQSLGCTRIVPYPVLFWKHWRTMPREDRLELPSRILERAGEMAAGYELLSDERSRREFEAQIRWRCRLDYDCLPRADDPREMYFPASLFTVLPEEVFVDCGAYDGDSIRTFLEASGGQFGRIYAWEADERNRGALRRYLEELSPATAGRVEILPYAVGARNETVRFCSEGTVGSRVAEDGAGQEVECRTIDSVLGNAGSTLIKMDIEGAEPEALRGAADTMAQWRPVIAACVYHKCEHLWEIPQLLKAGNPEYRIFLRRYAEDCWETVYYAIPPERLAAGEGAQA
jgi:FkbM family methyltransferase